MSILAFVVKVTYGGCVSSIWVVLQHPRQTKVWNLADQIAVDQDVPRSQVPVDVAEIRQIRHAGSDASEDPDQLNDGELTVVSL